MSAGSEESNVGGGEPSEAELRAAWEEQLRLLTPADVIVQTAVSLISLAGRRLGLEPGTEGERDLGQCETRSTARGRCLPVLERGEAGPTLGPLREAISALQFEYAKLAGVASTPRRRGARCRRRRRPDRRRTLGSGAGARARRERKAGRRACATQRPPLGAGLVSLPSRRSEL